VCVRREDVLRLITEMGSLDDPIPFTKQESSRGRKRPGRDGAYDVENGHR
jgi:hypothetical protein